MGEQGLLTALGAFCTKFILPWMPGYVGSFLALIFLGKRQTFWQKLCAFVAGVCAMYYCTPAIAEVGMVHTTVMVDAIKFALGLFAYALIDKLFKEIREADVISALRSMIPWKKP